MGAVHRECQNANLILIKFNYFFFRFWLICESGNRASFNYFNWYWIKRRFFLKKIIGNNNFKKFNLIFQKKSFYLRGNNSVKHKSHNWVSKCLLKSIELNLLLYSALPERKNSLLRPLIDDLFEIRYYIGRRRER